MERELTIAYFAIDSPNVDLNVAVDETTLKYQGGEAADGI